MVFSGESRKASKKTKVGAGMYNVSYSRLEGFGGGGGIDDYNKKNTLLELIICMTYHDI